MGRNSALLGRVLLMPAFIFALAFPACCLAGEAASLKVIATLFPQYDFTRQIAGDKAEVRLLLPPGAESHSYEPTPSDMKNIANADLFIYTGPHMEPWAKRLADSVSRPDGVMIVDASIGIRYRDGDEPHAEEGEDADSGHEADERAGEIHSHEFDPHIWLDPTLAAVMADNIAHALAKRDATNAETYLANARALREELEEMDAEFRRIVESSPRRALVFGERFAFAYFFDRYRLEEVGAYKSCAPGAEPGLKAVLEVIEYIKKNGVKFIYRETTSASRISKVLNQETGAEILTVDSLHNLPADKRTHTHTYQTVMRENMATFAKGLQ